MKYAIFLVTLTGLLALTGCVHEKSFEVTGIVPSANPQEDAAARKRAEPVPQKRAEPAPKPRRSEPLVVKAPQRNSRPELTFKEPPKAAPKAQRVSRPAVATFPEPSPAGSEPAKVTLVPDTGLTGKVASVNASLHFVVLNFPVGRMAAVEQSLVLYRQGQKVGEVKVTGPQQDDNIIADITSGEAETGDEVREK